MAIFSYGAIVLGGERYIVFSNLHFIASCRWRVHDLDTGQDLETFLEYRHVPNLMMYPLEINIIVI